MTGGDRLLSREKMTDVECLQHRCKRSRIMSEKETDRSVFERFTGKTPNRLTDQLRDIAPDAEKWINDFVFGTVYARDGLTDEEKAVATITTLAALPHPDGLERGRRARADRRDLPAHGALRGIPAHAQCALHGKRSIRASGRDGLGSRKGGRGRRNEIKPRSGI